MLQSVASCPTVESIKRFKKLIPDSAVTDLATDKRVNNRYCVKTFII